MAGIGLGKRPGILAGMDALAAKAWPDGYRQGNDKVVTVVIFLCLIR